MLWDDIRTASRHHMQMAFQLRRRRITYECKQVKTDVDSYNDAHPEERPIRMVLDFTQDEKELEIEDIIYSSANEPRSNLSYLATSFWRQYRSSCFSTLWPPNRPKAWA